MPQENRGSDISQIKFGGLLGGNRGSVAAIAFSPDGRWLASGGEDGAVRLWDLAAQPIGPSPVVLAGHERGVASLGFSPDSRRLATGDSASARLWDLTASPPATAAVIPAGRGVPVSQLSFAADRRRLIAASDAVRAWVLPLAELLELARRAAGRNFTADEWGRYFPGQAYRRTFPDLPGP